MEFGNAPSGGRICSSSRSTRARCSSRYSETAVEVLKSTPFRSLPAQRALPQFCLPPFLSKPGCGIQLPEAASGRVPKASCPPHKSAKLVRAEGSRRRAGERWRRASRYSFQTIPAWQALAIATFVLSRPPVESLCRAGPSLRLGQRGLLPELCPRTENFRHFNGHGVP